jgi:N-acylglucosamine 2-epimerase
MSLDLVNLAKQYENELFVNVVPFWEKHSVDLLHGGYFTCLSRDGQVFDTDKFVWLQCRQIWMFSKLHNTVRPDGNWLEMAEHGARFMKECGHDGSYNWYFSLNREGKPLVAPYNIFSDCFAAMAFGQLYKATGNEEYSTIAQHTFEGIMRRSNNPKGSFNKAIPGTRDLKGFSLPMILCNLSLEIEHLLPPELVNKTVNQCIHEVMTVFFDPHSGLIMENVESDGRLSDSFDGRLLNPGHAIEAMWFIMDLSVRLNRPELAEQAVKILLRTVEYGWDQQEGGLFYFLDRKGCPPQQLEWDQKLWWVHIETLISLIKGFALTGNPSCWEWFEKVHLYTWAHFPDPEFGEWFGYLNRRGEVLLPLKGGKWKGCFHVPRGLLNVWKTLDQIMINQS